MNFEIAVARGLDKANQTFLPKDVADMMYTTAIGMAMMKLQNAWSGMLTQDINQYNSDSANPDWDDTTRNEHLQTDQMRYKIDSSDMDAATSRFRSTFDGAKQQVTADTENEKNFTQLNTVVTSIASTVTRLVQRGSGMGKQTSG